MLHPEKTTPLQPYPLILGSTSRYRKELLARLGIPFEIAAPDVDETPLTHESPQALAMRLAKEKALNVAQNHPEAIVIGSDQVADLHGKPLGKPLTHENAIHQLQRMSGQTVIFHTAVAVTCSAIDFMHVDVAVIKTRFRNLSLEAIERYLHAEKPYDCAGSAKSEGLGISLLESIENDDPTALIGLPLIRTCKLLRLAGMTLP